MKYTKGSNTLIHQFWGFRFHELVKFKKTKTSWVVEWVWLMGCIEHKLKQGSWLYFTKWEHFPPPKAHLLSQLKKDNNNTKLWEYVEYICVYICICKICSYVIHDTWETSNYGVWPRGPGEASPLHWIHFYALWSLHHMHLKR